MFVLCITSDQTALASFRPGEEGRGRGGIVGIDRKLGATGKRSVRFTHCASNCFSLFNISFIF